MARDAEEVEDEMSALFARKREMRRSAMLGRSKKLRDLSYKMWGTTFRAQDLAKLPYSLQKRMFARLERALYRRAKSRIGVRFLRRVCERL